MPFADLTLDQWRKCSDHAAREMAETIAREHDARILDVTRQSAGPVALFERDGLQFSLVPGWAGRVGFDGAWFRPDPTQAASYAKSAAELGLPDVSDFVDVVTSPVRWVDLPAMLVATRSVEMGAEEIPVDDPDAVQLVETVQRVWRITGRTPPGGTRTLKGGGVRVTLDDDGAIVRAVRLRVLTYEQAVAALAGRGLRPTTPDEWEYTCGAGSRTLFRWGDGCPDTDDPHGLERGPHREPNAFGLTIADDPYRDERTADPEVVCGGDGGSAVHHERGNFLAWLTLATAYRDHGYATWLNEDATNDVHVFMRPVIDL